MDDIRADGRFKVIQTHHNRTGVGSETAGWLLGDEIDMTQGPTACPSQMNGVKAGLPADGRFHYANYGKGVIFWQTDPQAPVFVHQPPRQRRTISTGSAIPATIAAGVRVGSSYGDNEASCASSTDSTGASRRCGSSSRRAGRSPSPPRRAGARSAAEPAATVWHSLIAGARGIILPHSFGGPRAGDHHTIRSNSEGTRQITGQVNARSRHSPPSSTPPT